MKSIWLLAFGTVLAQDVDIKRALSDPLYEITPVKGTQINEEHFSFGPTWKVEFEIKFGGALQFDVSDPTSYNIFRIGQEEDDNCVLSPGCGCRIPAAWIHKCRGDDCTNTDTEGRLFISACVDDAVGNGSGMFDITSYNEWIPIEVGIEERSGGELWYYNSINGNILLEKKVTIERTMDNLNLWISDNLDEYAAGDFSEDVLIRGFRMSSGTWDSSTPAKDCLSGMSNTVDTDGNPLPAGQTGDCYPLPDEASVTSCNADDKSIKMAFKITERLFNSLNFDKTTYPPKREEKNKDGQNVYHYEIDPTANNMNMVTAENQRTLKMTHQLASAGKKTNGIVLGITNKLNFVCNYDMADQTIESSKFDVASGDVTFEASRSGTGTVHYDISVTSLEVKLGGSVEFNVTPKTPDLITAEVKHCTVENDGNADQKYDLMPKNSNGKICTDSHTSFANTAGSFQSKNAMSFKYSAFQWDMADKSESHTITCTLGLNFASEAAKAVNYDRCV